MIDKSGEWWIGETADDIDEYLADWSENDAIDLKSVKCHNCGCDKLYAKVDQDEGAIQVICSECKKEKIILDCEEVWEDADPQEMDCPICNQILPFYLKVGFIRRENGYILVICVLNVIHLVRSWIGKLIMDQQMKWKKTSSVMQMSI